MSPLQMLNNVPTHADNPPAYESTIVGTHTFSLRPHSPLLTTTTNRTTTACTDEGRTAAKHAAQGASTDAGRASTSGVRRHGAGGVPLPRPAHGPDGRVSLAPGPPEDGLSAGRGARPRSAVRVPRCVSSSLLFGSSWTDFFGGDMDVRRACGHRLVPSRDRSLSAGPARALFALWRNARGGHL